MPHQEGIAIPLEDNRIRWQDWVAELLGLTYIVPVYDCLEHRRRV
ncbi:hypothetical protein [Spirosoma spitsbergense]|nr:hypothetical protein [Spirosoma spitsbergense]